MEVIFHPLVRQDLVEMLRYYRKISDQLASEIYAEFRRTIDLAAETPLRFPPAERGFRRANLTRFLIMFCRKLAPVPSVSCSYGTTNAIPGSDWNESSP